MQKLCKLILKLCGWHIVGALPPNKQFILIAAPHTSNWDLVIGLLARFAVGVKINFLAKKQAFFFPLGLLLRAVGGTPVDRSKPGNRVEQVVRLFHQQEEFKLGMAPEGTRSPVTRWKEGFYHIANQAQVPIVLVGFDYCSKEIRVCDTLFWPTGDIKADFPPMLAFFRTIRGRCPKEIPDY